MRPSHREIINYETGWRLESLLRRLAAETCRYPRLAPGLSHAEVRRTINRLRSGAIRSTDPGIPSHVLADVLEGAIAQDQLIRDLVADMHSLRELEERLGRRAR
jgi:hypothetical protein